MCTLSVNRFIWFRLKNSVLRYISPVCMCFECCNLGFCYNRDNYLVFPSLFRCPLRRRRGSRKWARRTGKGPYCNCSGAFKWQSRLCVLQGDRVQICPGTRSRPNCNSNCDLQRFLCILRPLRQHSENTPIVSLHSISTYPVCQLVLPAANSNETIFKCVEHCACQFEIMWSHVIRQRRPV